MRRLFFVIFMIGVIGFVFYGLPFYQYYLMGDKGAVQNDAPIPATEESYVEIYKEQVTLKQAAPLDVLNAYSGALIEGKMQERRHLYTLKTQLILDNMRADMDTQRQAAFAIEECLPGQSAALDKFAVIRFDVTRRDCAPFFFAYEEDGWRLDLYAMQSNITFNNKNEWHFSFVPQLLNGPYGFAFQGWRFDQYGYPH